MRRAVANARLALALLLAASAWQVHAQDLLQVWEKALQRDPVHAAALAGRNAAQEIVPQARANLLPYVQADLIGDIDNTRRLRTLGDSSTDRHGLWALTLVQPVIDFGKWALLKQSEHVAASADLARQQAFQDLILRTAQAYFDVLAAQDSLRAFEAQKSAVTTQLEAAQRGFELGSTTIADTYEAQARLDLLNANILVAQNALQLSEDELAKIINERPGKLAELTANSALPAPSPNRLADWTAQSSQASLDVGRARLDTLIVERQLDIARSGHKPVLELQAQTGSATDRGIHGPGAGPRSLDTTVGLQLSIPLFAGGGISSQVREQTSRLQQARYALEAARRQAIQSTQQFFSGVTTGLAQVRALQAAEQSSLASLNANRTGYEVGVRINIDVLNAQQQLYETQRALAQARYDTLMNGLRLKAISGILSQDDIVAINQLLESGPQS